MAHFRRWYGAGPLHLLALAACFALAGYAGQRLLTDQPVRVVIWFVGAAVVHDLVLFPLYSLGDRTAQEATTAAGRTPASSDINYVRFPAFLSLLLLLVWLPEIIRVVVDDFDRSTALDGSVFLPRWLLITACLFAISAAVWGLRNLRRHRARRRSD